MLKPLEIDLSSIVPGPASDMLMIGYQIGHIAATAIAMRQAYAEHGITPRPWSTYVHPCAFDTVRDALRAAGYHVVTTGACGLDISIETSKSMLVGIDKHRADTPSQHSN